MVFLRNPQNSLISLLLPVRIFTASEVVSLVFSKHVSLEDLYYLVQVFLSYSSMETILLSSWIVVNSVFGLVKQQKALTFS